MTFDEIKNTLLSSGDEGVDKAAAFDTVLSEVSNVMYELEENKRKVEDLTNRVAELTDNNFKLLEKVKYMGEETPDKDKEEPEEITLENLFEEE